MSSVGGMFSQGSIPVLEKVVAFTEARHTLLAQNIANASTPGYKPVDLDEGEFRSLLQKAIAERDADHPGVFRMDRSDHFATRSDGTLEARAVRLKGGEVRHDGNAFNPERQMSQLADNTLTHERAVQLLASSYRLLETAIRGRV